MQGQYALGAVVRMSYSDRPEDRVPTQPLTSGRTAKQNDKALWQATSPVEPAPLSARAAAAQFDLAALLEAPTETLRERSLVTTSQQPRSEVTTSARPVPAQPLSIIGDDGASTREAGRLPSAWYKHADEIAEAARREQRTLILRGAAGVCLATGTALLFWLGAFGGKGMAPDQTASAASAASMASFAPARKVAIAVPAPSSGLETILPPPIDPNARALVTTAQILAVAERFVATGDVLAARAILSDTAASGDARALFALAETYDPNLLASWNAQKAEPSISYARLLYEAALRNGLADAQTRLDALK